MNNITHCHECGSDFGCHINSVVSDCWCTQFPPVLSINEEMQCLCPECLGRTIEIRIKEELKRIGAEELLKKAKHEWKTEKLIEYLDYTIEDGNYVFSSWYHLKRGYCCDSGCRNCPYR